MADNQQDLIVALDVGTSKVVTLIAQVSPEGLLEVIGIGKKAFRGLKRGRFSRACRHISICQPMKTWCCNWCARA